MPYLINSDKFFKEYEISSDGKSVWVTRGVKGEEETVQSVLLTRDELVLLISEIDKCNLDNKDGK